MSANKVIFVFSMMMIVTISPLTFADSNNKENISIDQNQITGHANLSFMGNLSTGSQINATWDLEISIPEDYGTDLLPNQSIGIRSQIDNYLGDADGNITESEVSDFTQLVVNARSWSNSEVAGCCIFD